MNGKDYDWVEEMANCLVEDLGLQDFPVNCFEVAWLLGIEIKKYSEIPLQDRNFVVSSTEDGYSICIAGKFIVYYNDEMPKTRVKFTIWHEIAHIQLGHLEPTCTKSYAQMEEEANHFAAYIMAPLAFVYFLKLEDPLEIADVCGISIDLACNVYAHYQNAMFYPNVKRRILGNRITRLLMYNNKFVA